MNNAFMWNAIVLFAKARAYWNTPIQFHSGIDALAGVTTLDVQDGLYYKGGRVPGAPPNSLDQVTLLVSCSRAPPGDFWKNKETSICNKRTRFLARRPIEDAKFREFLLDLFFGRVLTAKKPVPIMGD